MFSFLKETENPHISVFLIKVSCFVVYPSVQQFNSSLVSVVGLTPFVSLVLEHHLIIFNINTAVSREAKTMIMLLQNNSQQHQPAAVHLITDF